MNQLAPGITRAGRAEHGRHAWTRRIGAVVGLSLLTGLLSPVAFAADVDPLGKPKLQAPRASKVSPLTSKVNKKNADAVAKSAAADQTAAKRARTDQRRTVAWPTSDTATLSLLGSGKAKAEPGSLPLTLTRPKAVQGKKSAKAAETVKVKVLDQKATTNLGVKGVALAVTGPKGGGKARLGIDYSAFASAYGGDWAGRLQILELGDCALSDPRKAKCRKRQPLEFTNDRGAEELKTQLAFSESSFAGETMVLALAAGTQSGAGDYKATPLASSSTWEAGGSSGTFTWSYPLRTPPAAAGPAPGLSISYDSGSVDGRTASTNNQGTVIGEGFDLTSSYIERKYGSCDDDGQTDKFDLCWKYDNASLVLNGRASELVKDDTTGKWRLKTDDASTVTHSTGAENGDDNGEYWTVVTGDGTKYVFGLNKLAGAGTDDRTESVWTVPVFGDDSGEPGYADGTTFSGRDKKQAWRWNLDLVEDTHQNAMTYWYKAETNYYDKLGDDNNGTAYTRGGYLEEIRYGQRADALFSATPAASNKVTFYYAERCLASGTGCDALTADTRDNWPDVPFDTACKADAKCTGNLSPSFFTRKRMTSITTSAWDAAATTPAYAAVDSWALKQLYLDPGDTGDSTDQSLWLDEIKHTGKRGTDLALDPVKFTHAFLPNRVDGPADDILSLDKPRLRTVTSEAGAQTTVSYMEADCVYGQTMPKVDENTRRCYPVYWSPNGEKEPILDWFQKYPVTAVSTSAPHGGSEPVQHTYTYQGGGAWHYNNDPLTKEKERTWSVWRGYGKVTHLTGDSDSAQLKTVSVYMRGMNGDRLLGPDGKTPDPDQRKTAKVTGIKAGEITDSDQYAGFTRETVIYNGTAEVSGTVNDPWSKRTATQHKSYADTEAYYVRVGATHARTNITSGIEPRDRVRTTATTYDDYGMAVTVEDKGDNAVDGDEKCTRNWYARNDTAGINSLISRTRVTGQPCATTDDALNLPADSSTAGDVISDIATAYDTTTWSPTHAPTKGEAQWTGRAKAYTTANDPTWQKVAATTYDTLGRPLAVKDTNDLTTTTTSYTPVAAGPLTASTVTNAKLHKTTTTVDFATGAPLKATDPNGKVTETEYDSLGRTTKIWLPNRSKVLGKTPNYVYGYQITNSALPWVSTGILKGDGSGYNTAYQIYDSLLRIRQVQTPTPIGGRAIALTLYDDRGLAVSAQGDIWDNTAEPSGTAVQTEGSQAPVQTDTTYDGAGRATKAVTKNWGVNRWTTETFYRGDTVASTAPSGGQATAVVTNALGQTTKRFEYGGPQPTGSDFTTTDYTYTAAGQQKTVTGHDQAKWSYGYDLFGRQTSASDPDKGSSTTHYNTLDQVESTKSSLGKTLVSEYDDLGRKTGLWDGTKTDATKLAAWTFDALAKGQQDTAVRYVNGINQTGSKAYTSKATAYDSLYQVTGSQLVLPTSDPLVVAGVPATLSFTTGYRLDGTISQASQPAVGGLAAETVGYTYNALGGQLTSQGTTGYLQGAAYSPVGDLNQLTLGMDGSSTAKKAYLNYEYEAGTRRLERSFVTDDVHGYMPQDLNFNQDDAGNVTSIFDASNQGGTTKPDYQCFAYDGHRRMTEAWTPRTADCAATGRTVTNIDGQAPYWTSYTYNNAGQRKIETTHTATGNATTTYEYGTTTGQPHPLNKTTGAKAGTYTHDAAGNTKTRPGTQATQTLNWNSEGQLTSSSEPAAGTKPATGTSYLYDASGELLIRRATTADGDTVLYLGSTEVRLTVKGTTKTLSGTRYYTAAGQSIAVRTATSGVTGTKLKFLAADHHGTSSLALDATTWAITKRYTAPFGASRGPKPTTWPDDKAFLGKPADTTTGLTHIGAREYDPGIGQFISVDPVLSLDQHQSINGYTYGNNNPVTFSDPTGLEIGSMPNSCQYDIKYCTPKEGGKSGGGKLGGGATTGTSPNSSTGATFDDGQPVVNGLRIPKNNELGYYASAYAAKDTYSYRISRWLVSKCHNGNSVACGMADKAGLLETEDDPFGIAVGVRCVTKGKDCGEAAVTVALYLVGVGWEWALARRAAASAAATAKGGSGSVEALIRGAGCAMCFLAGTDVLMADGSTKNIEDVKIGDEVLATDPETGETGPRKVTRLIVTEDDKHFNQLTIETDDGPKKLSATHEHPFWSPSEKQWVEASKLRPGMTLLTDDGSTVHVRANRAFDKHARTYNLTVDDLHTYYVLAGQTPVLVHNSNCPLTGGFKAGVSPDEIADINRGFGGETLLSGSPANTLANASRYNSFWDKSAVVIRDIAGSHMFNNGNKRTAQATVEQLMQRNGVTSGPTSADLRSVIDRVGKGQLHDVSDISAALRGY
ncbi:polymorphic toxin-type HINT domain-containing protein [Streptomyces albidochromogenes]|uniref:Polymorphic toxin-type HINT domain-containing protein n=1 Tax=Streptomyces albidochromogenes TaxID=329524 RepID=A0ABW6FEL4_9ACTN